MAELCSQGGAFCAFCAFWDRWIINVPHMIPFGQFTLGTIWELYSLKLVHAYMDLPDGIYAVTGSVS